jgi:hypothetical protein
MAGMLVIPGSGVATAEDMQELAAPAVVSPEDASVPEVAAPDAGPEPQDPRERIALLGAQLNEQQRNELQAWAAERKIDLSNVNGNQVRPVLLQLERKLAESE